MIGTISFTVFNIRKDKITRRDRFYCKKELKKLLKEYLKFKVKGSFGWVTISIEDDYEIRNRVRYKKKNKEDDVE